MDIEKCLLKKKIVIGLLSAILGFSLLIGCGGGGGNDDAQSQSNAPVITTQPASQTVTAGQTVVFSVTVAGADSITYQWMKNDTAISGATAASYTTPAATLSNNGDTFTVVVQNGAGSVTSNQATLTVSSGNLATQISQYGITWTFDKAYPIGQFANGDYWVVGPVRIIGISPESKDIDGRIMNGSMINPAPSNDQGYDNTAYASTYVASLNVALGISATAPLAVPTGSSLISSVSLAAAVSRPQLKTAAILTVLATAPAAGSFRPPYCGTDKTIRFNVSQLNYTLLGGLTPVSSTPLLSDIERKFQRVWLDHVSGWAGRFIHPADNMEDYGEYIAGDVSDGALMLHLNFTNAQKETLLIRFVQLGIDNFGIIQNGPRDQWAPDGGHCAGRKWPILFAGIMLNDTDMKNIGQKSGNYLYTYNYPAYGPGNVPPDYIHFQEDGDTFYVTHEDVALGATTSIHNNITFYGHYYPPDDEDLPEYTSSDIGLPEWGIRHSTFPIMDGNAWNITYRNANGCTWAGFILSARIMYANTPQLWNHNALFEYQDRHMAVTAAADLTPIWRYSTYSSYTSNTQFIQSVWATESASRASSFQADMWDTYRHLY